MPVHVSFTLHRPNIVLQDGSAASQSSRSIEVISDPSHASLVVFQLSHENVYEVLCAADMYLLPGLKRLCGRTLAALLNEENVLHMWKTAKLFRLSRLEDLCTEYMAKIIERVCVHSQISCWWSKFTWFTIIIDALVQSFLDYLQF